jgi:putative DNA primase/helicase
VTKTNGRIDADTAPKPYVIPPKPTTLSLEAKAIPPAIKAVSAWVGWRFELIPERQQWTKIPVNLNRGSGKRHASSTDSDTWVSFPIAVAKYRKWGCDGIGCCVTPGWVFVDLDGVLDGGQLREECPWAADIVKKLEGRAYVEVSPSGDGLHLITRGTLPPGGSKKSFPKLGGKVGYELYDSGKYFAFTGHVHEASSAPLQSSKRLALLHASLFPSTVKGTNGKTDMTGFAPHTVPHTGMDDDDLLEKAHRANNGAKFSRLFDNGDCTGYDSQSEADLALCSLLAFWTGGDRMRIDHLFRRSNLYREKWDRDDYRNRVIEKALAGKTEFYNPPAMVDLSPASSVAPAKAARNFPFTDMGNAERLVAQHGHDIRWCDPFKCWFVWNDFQWLQDKGQMILTRAKSSVRAMYVTAGRLTDEDKRKALATHARRSEARSRVDAMIALARPDVAVTPEQFDRDRWLLNVQNGTIELRHGQLQEHRREDLCTKLAGIPYDSEAKCPRWKRFLQEVFAPHKDLIPFIQRAIGYSLTGDVREECFFLLAGSGRNGKGTLLKTIQTLVGDYAGTADFATFIARRDGGMRDDVANMRGQRFVVAQEAHEGAALAEGVIKWLTGGDRVRARRLYENSSEFDPTFKLWLATNYKPEVRGTDPAIWSRIKLIPFDVSFEGHEDKTLKQELLKELPGILAWAVRGCLQWQKNGLHFPSSVVEATKEYRTDSDQVGRFLSDCCVKDPKKQTKASTLYETYKAWCEANGEKLLTSTGFGTRMRGCPGVSKQITRQSKVYSGVVLREEE